MSMSTSTSKEQPKEEQDTNFSSPTSVILPCLPNHHHHQHPHQQHHQQHHQDDNFKLTPSSYPINLERFIQLLPDTIRSSNTKHASTTTVLSTSMNNMSSMNMNMKMVDTDSSGSSSSSSSSSNGTHDDPIGTLFRRLTTSKEELTPYSFIDTNKNYTRNLIATDDETFTLLLLCWNPGKYSPIHDHPCDGCWMRVCQGCVNEVRYDVVKEDKEDEEDDDDEEKGEKLSSLSSSFICTMDTTFEKGQQTFIDDNLGYHKVGNPSMDVLAISMHLYSPPFQKCKIWLDPRDASSSSISCMCNFSEYGHRVKTMKK